MSSLFPLSLASSCLLASFLPERGEGKSRESVRASQRTPNEKKKKNVASRRRGTNGGNDARARAHTVLRERPAAREISEKRSDVSAARAPLSSLRRLSLSFVYILLFFLLLPLVLYPLGSFRRKTQRGATGRAVDGIYLACVVSPRFYISIRTCVGNTRVLCPVPSRLVACARDATITTNITPTTMTTVRAADEVSRARAKFPEGESLYLVAECCLAAAGSLAALLILGCCRSGTANLLLGGERCCCCCCWTVSRASKSRRRRRNVPPRARAHPVLSPDDSALAARAHICVPRAHLVCVLLLALSLSLCLCTTFFSPLLFHTPFPHNLTIGVSLSSFRVTLSRFNPHCTRYTRRAVSLALLLTLRIYIYIYDAAAGCVCVCILTYARAARCGEG